MTHEQFWLATRALRRRYNRLWLADHTARTILRRETTWTTRRLAAYERLVAQALQLGGRRGTVERVEDLAPAEFKLRYLDTDTPVVLARAGSQWPAAQWSHKMLGERYGGTTVRLLRAAPNEPKGKPGEGQNANYAEIARSMDEGGDLYARFSGIMHQHPELVDDVDVDWFRSLRHDHKSFENWGFFMGGANTATGLHSSIAPNLFYQITGKKRWYIYPAQAAPLFAPAVKCSPYFYSEVDVNDSDKWPIAEAAPGWVADLEPGDVLYVPSFAWHQVHNFTPTLAVGYRWVDPRLGWRASPIQTLLAVTCSNPPVWKAKGHKDLPSLLDAIDY
jgi:lysine-specific demethylase 8